MPTPNTHHGAQYIRDVMIKSYGKSIFFAGVGGVMMSSLALLTKRAGYNVIGSDRSQTPTTQRLERSGIYINYLHSADNINDSIGAFVYTVAISPDNPEYLEAQRRNIPCISRADYLGYIMTEYKNRIGIAGMHGKSTVTSMCAQIFMTDTENGGFPMPTVISGAEYKPMGGAYHIGENENFIFEACEYMDSFLDFNPTVAVLLNAEMEHVDYFKSMEHINSSFAKYAGLTGSGGVCVANADDENIMLSVKDYCGKLITFGLKKPADYTAKNIRVENARLRYDLVYNGEIVADISLAICGEHNVYNSMAAAAAAHVCGVPFSNIEEGLCSFVGAGRRMEYRGRVFGADVYDDYGHHPTEVEATLKGAAEMFCGRRIICVFQPHTYSRTASLIDSFKNCFDAADMVILADIYAARETNIYGISSKDLCDKIGERAIYGGSFGNCGIVLQNNLCEDDVVVVMGAGDIYKIYSVLGLNEKTK